MKELSITVACPGEPEATYRFNEYPVRIGRSLECDLCICHEAVPRELCSVWLKSDGKTVRVEERPNLSNPLRNGKSVVTGGASGTKLLLAVGPVILRVMPWDQVSDMPEFKRGRPKLILAVAALLSVCMAAFFWPSGTKTSKSVGGIDRLPVEPFCGEIEEHCDSPESCIERARLLLTRAKEMTFRADGDPLKKVHSAMMLEKSAHLYGSFGDPAAKGVSDEAKAAKEEVAKSYRQDVVALRRAIGNKDTSQIAARAARVRAYLQHCSSKERLWLDHLIAQMGEKER